MSEILDHITELSDQAKEYVNTRIDVIKLNTAAKVSTVTSNIIAGTIVAVVFVFFLLFGGMAAGFALGDWLGKNSLGFLIVAAIYLLLGVITWLSKEKLLRIPVMNAIIQQLFNYEKDQE